MTSTQRIRNELQALISSVPGTGQVHPYERFAVKSQEFARLYQQGQRVQGFFVHRQGSREYQYSSQLNRVRTRWVIRGFASLVDAEATELAFDDLLDALRAAVRARPVLYDAADNALAHTSTDDGAGLQLDESGPVMFAGVLCHGATFSLTTEHLEEIEPYISDPTASPGPVDPENPTQQEQNCPCYRAAIIAADVSAPAVELTRPFAAPGDNDNG